jgi:hypothetical protein
MKTPTRRCGSGAESHAFEGAGGMSENFDRPSRGRGVSFALVKLRFFSRIVSRMKKSGNTPLRIVADLDQPGPQGPQPSRPLGEHGAKLWARVLAEYDVSDAAGVEMLTQACLACDRAEALAAHVNEEGEIVPTPQGVKAHPAIREELSCRGFIVRTLQKLGLNFEPVRAGPGRPPGR